MRITVMPVGFATAFKNQDDLDSVINSLMKLKLDHADGKAEYPAVLLFHEERPLSAFGPKTAQIIANSIVEGDKAISDYLKEAGKKQDAEKAASVESNFPKPIMCTAHPKKSASGYYEQPLETPHNPEHDIFVCPGCAEKAVAEGKKVQGILKKLQEQAKDMPSPVLPGTKRVSTLVQVMDPKTKKPVGAICKIQTIRESKLHLMDPNGAISVVDPEKVLVVGEQTETGDGKPPLVTLYKDPIKPDFERWKKAEENLDKKRTQLETAVEKKLEDELEKEGEKPEPRKLSQEEIDAASKRAIQVGDIVKQFNKNNGLFFGPRCKVVKVVGDIVDDENQAPKEIHAVHIDGGLKGTEEMFAPETLVVVVMEEKAVEDPATKDVAEKVVEKYDTGDVVRELQVHTGEQQGMTFGPPCMIETIDGDTLYVVYMDGDKKGSKKAFDKSEVVMADESEQSPSKKADPKSPPLTDKAIE